MSAASRAREAAAAAALATKRYADLPEPGQTDREMLDPDDIAGHVQLWDFERVLGWFVTNRKEIAEALGVESVFLDGEDGLLVTPKSRVERPVPFFGTFRHDAPRKAVEG